VIEEDSFPFELYAYQKECLKIIKETDTNIIVETPTSSGKTVISEIAIIKALKTNTNLIYTTPLKALSNQKYLDFKEKYGNENLGLVTGDFVINRNAQIVIMTTEVLRNILLNDKGFLDNVSYIVIDEAHYINDIDRGTVFEEIVILTPENISLILLSATISNSEILKDWIESTHKSTILIRETIRPVPLNYFYYNNLKLLELKEEKQLPKLIEKFDINKFLLYLDRENKLPAIYFHFNRVDCNNFCKDIEINLLNKEEKQKVSKIIKEFCIKYPFFEYSFLKKSLLKGFSAHHSGLLPQIKVLIEDLYLHGLIKVVFATESLSVGIQLPVKTVILSSLKKYVDE
jgi:superfamily II RNA helicase